MLLELLPVRPSHGPNGGQSNYGRASRNFVLHGPRQALAESLVDADLVVVGPRGIGGLARTVLGSVTTWLLHDAACPVAIVPTAD